MIRKKYPEGEIKKYGIWITYLISPLSFHKVVSIHFKGNIQETITKEFDKDRTDEDVNNFIDDAIRDKILKYRKEKLNKIIKRNENFYTP